MFPIWTIVLIIILIVIAIAVAIYFIKRRRSRSLSVHTIHERDEEEKKSVSTETLVTQKQQHQQQQHQPLPLDTPQLPASNESEQDAPEPPQEIKISLPLPPPSTLFFTDKMELDSQDLFDMYLNSKKKKEEGFLQQKAATIKSTLRQSLRPQQKNSVLNLFNQQPSESEPTITFVKEPESSNKTSVEIQPPSQPQPQQPQINVEHVVAIDESDESPITPNPHLQEPVRAAKRVLRSASRKTKTRSVTNNNSNEMPPNSEKQIVEEQQKLEEEPKMTKQQESTRFNSVRGVKGNGEHLTITSGSIRRFVRENAFNDEEGLPPAASTRKTARKSNNTSAADISSWWEDSTPKQQQQEEKKPVTSGEDNSSAPHQYRASLNTSIFAGTLSRSSASLFADTTKEETNSNGSVSRHGSFRRGTLGRNTLKSITATATSGVNRSLKGLFDYSSNNSSTNKIVPDDSQKMELDDEPPVSVAEEKLAIGQHGVYNSVRSKSVRASTVTRPGLPTSYLPTSESSTKYALSDEEAELTLKNPKNMSSSSSYNDHKNVETTSPTSTTSPLSPITVISDHTSTQPGEVDAIRRVLQDTWMNKSGSSYSMLSDTDSVATSSTQQSKLNPRQQNQALLSKSLLTQQVAKRASLLARQSMHEDDFLQGPEPSASFSSSTVRTMIPEQEPTRQNAIKHGSNKIQEDHSADSSRGHSRKSSGANSAATALRISSGYAANAKTWNGRKAANRPSVVTPEDMYASQSNNRAFFSTMRKGQKSRGNIPWLMDDGKTPAQMERDRYLEGNS